MTKKEDKDGKLFENSIGVQLSKELKCESKVGINYNLINVIKNYYGIKDKLDKLQKDNSPLLKLLVEEYFKSIEIITKLFPKNYFRESSSNYSSSSEKNEFKVLSNERNGYDFRVSGDFDVVLSNVDRDYFIEFYMKYKKYIKNFNKEIEYKKIFNIFIEIGIDIFGHKEKKYKQIMKYNVILDKIIKIYEQLFFEIKKTESHLNFENDEKNKKFNSHNIIFCPYKKIVITNKKESNEEKTDKENTKKDGGDKTNKEKTDNTKEDKINDGENKKQEKKGPKKEKIEKKHEEKETPKIKIYTSGDNIIIDNIIFQNNTIYYEGENNKLNTLINFINTYNLYKYENKRIISTLDYIIFLITNKSFNKFIKIYKNENEKELNRTQLDFIQNLDIKGKKYKEDFNNIFDNLSSTKSDNNSIKLEDINNNNDEKNKNVINQIKIVGAQNTNLINIKENQKEILNKKLFDYISTKINCVYFMYIHYDDKINEFLDNSLDYFKSDIIKKLEDEINNLKEQNTKRDEEYKKRDEEFKIREKIYQDMIVNYQKIINEYKEKEQNI